MDTSQIVFWIYTAALTMIILAVPTIMILLTLRLVKKAGRTLFTTKRRLVKK